MQLNKVSKALAAVLVIATPILLVAPGTSSLAKKPGNRPVCAVGTAAYPTIQSAVNDAACSTIGVPAGTFRESVNILRSVTVRGEGPDRTIVDGTGIPGPVFQFAAGSPNQPGCPSPGIAVTLEGMTITGGTGEQTTSNRNGGGIAGTWSALTVTNVIVTGNTADWHGGGISVASGTVSVKDSVITGNTSRGLCTNCNSNRGGGGIRVAGCPNVVNVYDSVISNNVSETLGGGLSVYSTVAGSPATLTVKDSSITGNTAWLNNGGGGIYYSNTLLTVRNTEISGNSPNNLQEGPYSP
jgi:hypothetical protein